MTWGAKVSATQLTSITTEEFFDAVITLAPGEQADVEVEFNPPTTPTDDLVVSVYGTLDESSENWDDTPILSFTISNAIDPNKASFVLAGFYKMRIGVKRSGTTDTITSADMSYRKDGVSL